MSGLDTNTLLYCLFGVIGAGYALFLRWGSGVNSKLDLLEKTRVDCIKEFLTKAEFEQSKDRIWQKFREHDSRIASLELDGAVASVRKGGARRTSENGRDL